MDQIPEQIANKNPDKPLVSVIMSFHNARDTLATSLQSLFWQTYENWELILLDDGSTDSTEIVLAALQDPRITLVRESVCRGLPVRLNQGIALAKGRYIARMDADDIAFPERFATQVAYLQNHPNVDLLSTSALMIDDKNQPIGLLSSKSSHQEICRRPWRSFPMPHPTWMGKAAWFKKYLYHEQAKKSQDQELLLRTFQHSCFASLPDVLLGYRYAHLSLRKRLLSRYHHLKILHIHGNLLQLLFGITVHVLAAGRDVIAIATGTGSRAIAKKVTAIDSPTQKQWAALQQDLSLKTHKTADP
jgi:glycosyltransferase involved in cell wall biosynthesis